MRKPVIEEIIVVEGKDDTRRLKEVLNVDTIETNGSAINEVTLEKIALAQEVRGVIVFTDPDYAGEKIRKTIMREVPAAKHAFLGQKEAKAKQKGRSLGVEHASDEAILTALEKMVTPIMQVETREIDRQELYAYGLIAGEQAKARRVLLGEYLGIGYTNGKQLEKRLAMFRISKGQLNDAMKKVEENL